MTKQSQNCDMKSYNYNKYIFELRFKENYDKVGIMRYKVIIIRHECGIKRYKANNENLS